jgi:hypothetical protein
MNDDVLGSTSRRLRDLVEPIAASIYFAPEAHANYDALGLDFFRGYFCSRGACLGTAPWSVICAAFGVFKPAVVEQFVNEGWAKTSAEPMLAARLAGAEASIERMCGAPDEKVERATEILYSLTDGLDVSGRALFGGLSAQPRPSSPWGALWHAADLVRERRGDAHIGSWIPHFDACEVSTITELALDLPSRSFVYTRGWDASEVDAAQERLTARGLMDGPTITGAGRALRGEIERVTDAAEREVVERLGDRADELFGLLEPWSRAILDAKGYPADPAELPEIRS